MSNLIKGERLYTEAEVEAIAKAALERAAEHHDRHAERYARTCQHVDKAVHQEHARRIRSIAFDPAEMAAIIKAAGERHD